MYEKVNPAHPDKIADRIAGALVDLAYQKAKDPKIAVEVLVGHRSMSNTLVLDPFGGSGSTLIACEQTDRSCATIELDEKFCDVIVKRYIELVGTADHVTLLRDGKECLYSEVAADG